jgi:Lrp/AsnC family leucine-responsive transcriptional regulator
MMEAMDQIDRDILSLLTRNGRMRWGELAAAVHLSPNAVADRVRRLQRTGVITGFTLVRDWPASGRPIHAYVDVKLGAGVHGQRFEAELATHDAVDEAHHVTGRYDYLIAGHFVDLAHVDELLTSLKEQGLVAETETRFVLRSAPGAGAAD